MAGMDWFRWHHGSVTDPKFQLVARKAGASLPDVLAVWAFILEKASAASDRGCFGVIDAEALDCLFNFPGAETRSADILRIFDERGLTADGRIVRWEERQPKRERTDDDSSQRVQRYRERVRAGGGSVGGYLKHHAYLMRRDGGKCVYCGTTENLCIDHLIPVIQGGDDERDNLAMACKACNSGKAGRTPEQYGKPLMSEGACVDYAAATSRHIARLSRHVTPREDKSREEEKEHPPTPRKRGGSFDPKAMELPAWLPPELWAMWCDDRAARGKKVTERGATMSFSKLAEYRADGFTPKAVIEHSIAGGFQGLYPPPKAKQDTARTTVPGPSGPDAALEKIKRDDALAVPPPAHIRAQIADALKGKVLQ